MLKALLSSILAVVFALPGWADSPGDLERRAVERRAVEAAIWGLPAVNYDLMLQEMLAKTTAQQNQVVYWGRPMDSMNQTLTPNPDTLYFMAFFDTREAGPMVLEIPPAEGGSLNGNIVTLWQEPLEDAGLLGADKGKGGKYLILPPGYDGAVPEGYVALPSNTFGTYALLRVNLKSHGAEDVAAAVAYGQRVKVYPLSQAASPPATVFTDAQTVLFDSTIRYDSSLFDHLNRIVQSEPWLQRDLAMIDVLKTLGIEQGKAFAPSAETRILFDAAAAEAGALLDARYDAGMPAFFEGSTWTFPTDFAAAIKDGYARPGSYPVDLRALIYSFAFIALKHAGEGQFYLVAIRDADGDAFDGAKSYRLTVPPNAPVEQYWSITAYDRQTHALIKGMSRASRSSQIPELRKHADGSVDIYFGPTAPAGLESNWVPTDPQRPFDLMFRLYAPTKAFFEKSWVLPDVEKLK